MPGKERIKRKREEANRADAVKCRRLLDFFSRPSLDASEVVTFEERVQPNSEVETSCKKPEQKKNAGHKIGFNSAWQKDRPWLQYEEELESEVICGKMFCSLCQKWDMKGKNGSLVWNKTGCETLRLDKITLHENSQLHQEAISLEKKEIAAVDDTFKGYQQKTTDALVDAQKVLYFLIKHNLPHTTLFQPLIQLCTDLGATNLGNLASGKNATHTGHSTIQEFIDCQAEVVEETVLEKVRGSESYGLMLDECTDVSTRKHLAFVGRYVENGESRLAFLQNIEIPNGTADTIVENVKDFLSRTQLDQKKMTCFASDGPAVMTGKRNGVVTQLKRDNQSLIDVHCVNHRLQLAISDAFKSVPAIASIDELLMGLFKYYHYSTVRTKSLEQMQKLYGEMEGRDTVPLTIKKAVHTRWLSHEKALHTVRHSYGAILADLENAVGMGNDKKAGDRQSVTAEGLYKQLTSYDRFFTILLLCDVCSLLASLAKLFERRDLDLSIVEPQFRSVIGSLKTMQEKPGPYLSKLDQLSSQFDLDRTENRRGPIEDAKTDFLNNLIENMESRLKATPMLTSLSALDLRKAGDSSLLSFHGDLEITELAEHLGLNGEETLVQWGQMKELFSEDLENSSPPVMLKTLTKLKPQLGSLYPNMVKLLTVNSTLILSTSEVERVFSKVKLIITDHRNRLSVMNCNKLLMVSLNTNSCEDIDLEEVVRRYVQKKNRRLL